MKEEMIRVKGSKSKPRAKPTAKQLQQRSKKFAQFRSEHDKLYEADRREWNRLMTQTKFGRLAKLAQKKGW